LGAAALKAAASPSPPSIPVSNLKTQDLYKQAVAVLGLPQDTLTLTLVDVLRYFSLSPDAALITRLRRELLAAGSASAPKTGREKAALEAKALAAAAAADKGLRLSPEALEEYAAATEPGAWFSGGHSRGRDKDNPKDNPDDWEEVPNGEELEDLYATAGGDGEKEDLLSYLNRIPGKSGRHWIVFPFKLKVKGIELSVSVRLLIKGSVFFTPGSRAPTIPAHLIVDIEGPQKRWRFILDKAGDGMSVMDILVGSACEGNLAQLKKEAERSFSGPGMEVRLREEDFAPGKGSSLFDPWRQEALYSVNKEV
jgi:hypothetical protein